jgi:hypothetical protein
MHRREKLVGIRDIPSKVSTGAQERLQPWQALFAVFTYALTQFDIGQTNTIILLGMIIVGLGFVQRSTYRHKEAVKEIVAPWAVEQAIRVLSDYLEPKLPDVPVEEEPVVAEPTREELVARLEALGKEEE